MDKSFYIENITFALVIVCELLYLHYFNVLKMCQNRVRFTASELKGRHMVLYYCSCLENLPALHNQIRKFSKKPTLSISRFVKVYVTVHGCNEEEHGQCSRKTIHMIIV